MKLALITDDILVNETRIGNGYQTGLIGGLTIDTPDIDLFSDTKPEIYSKPPVTVPDDGIGTIQNVSVSDLQNKATNFFENNDKTVNYIIIGAIIYFLFLR